MKVPPYFVSNPHPITVNVIGAGGTGSMLLQNLARINKALVSKGRHGLLVNCIDDDVVTTANLGRQLFAQNDIGRSKAVAIIERINRFYGTSWNAYRSRFTKSEYPQEVFPCNVIITCVDNVKTRKSVHNYIRDEAVKKMRDAYQFHFWIDTGNTKTTGQVIMGAPAYRLPTVIDMHPDAQKDEKKDLTPSCSLAEALEKQDLFINSTVAQVTSQLMWDLLSKEEINWRGAYINLDKMTPIRKIRI